MPRSASSASPPAGSGRAGPEHGAGLLASVSGLMVLLLCLLFAVQLLISLHATTVLTAVTSDTARRAAAEHAPDRRYLEAELVEGLGRMGRQAEITWGQDSDIVSLTVSVPAPRFVPPSLSATVGLDRIERTVRVRMERFDAGAAP